MSHHKILSAPRLISEDELDQLAAEGWLLITIVRQTEQTWTFYFRREGIVN